MNRSALKRRQLLALLGIGAGSGAAAMLLPQLEARSSGTAGDAALPFVPVRGPLPVPSDGLSAADQRRLYGTFSVDDKLLVPEGYRAELIAVWGDRLATGRFGFNNDYLAFQALPDARALLSVNFEFISPQTWAAGFSEAVGTPLPLEPLQQALAAAAAVWMWPAWLQTIRCAR